MAAPISATNSGRLNPVVRHMYKRLMRLSEEYGQLCAMRQRNCALELQLLWNSAGGPRVQRLPRRFRNRADGELCFNAPFLKDLVRADFRWRRQRLPSPQGGQVFSPNLAPGALERFFQFEEALELRTAIVKQALPTESEAWTAGYRVRAASRWDERASDPTNNRWVFSFTIDITMDPPAATEARGGDAGSSQETPAPPAIIAWRHFETTCNGRHTSVRRPGIQGTRPELSPTRPIHFRSYQTFPAPVARMHGRFGVTDPATGAEIEIQLAEFAFEAPAEAVAKYARGSAVPAQLPGGLAAPEEPIELSEEDFQRGQQILLAVRKALAGEAAKVDGDEEDLDVEAELDEAADEASEANSDSAREARAMRLRFENFFAAPLPQPPLDEASGAETASGGEESVTESESESSAAEEHSESEAQSDAEASEDSPKC